MNIGVLAAAYYAFAIVLEDLKGFQNHLIENNSMQSGDATIVFMLAMAAGLSLRRGGSPMEIRLRPSVLTTNGHQIVMERKPWEFLIGPLTAYYAELL